MTAVIIGHNCSHQVCEQVFCPTDYQYSHQWQHDDVPWKSSNSRNRLENRQKHTKPVIWNTGDSLVTKTKIGAKIHCKYINILGIADNPRQPQEDIYNLLIKKYKYTSPRYVTLWLIFGKIQYEDKIHNVQTNTISCLFVFFLFFLVNTLCMNLISATHSKNLKRGATQDWYAMIKTPVWNIPQVNRLTGKLVAEDSIMIGNERVIIHKRETSSTRLGPSSSETDGRSCSLTSPHF